MRNATASEQSVSDGTRHLGHLVPKAGVFECFDAAGTYLCKAATVAEARRAILAADRGKAAAS